MESQPPVATMESIRALENLRQVADSFGRDLLAMASSLTGFPLAWISFFEPEQERILLAVPAGLLPDHLPLESWHNRRQAYGHHFTSPPRGLPGMAFLAASPIFDVHGQCLGQIALASPDVPTDPAALLSALSSLAGHLQRLSLQLSLRRLEEMLETTQRLSAIIETQYDVATAELDVTTVINLIVERIQELTPACGVRICRLVGDRVECTACGGRGFLCDRKEALTCQHPERPDPWLLESIRNGEIIRARALHLTEGFRDPSIDTSLCASMVMVPLQFNRQTLGTLQAVAREVGAFSDRDEHTLQLLAGILAAAMTHAQELREKRTLLEERTAAMGALHESQELFHAFMDHSPAVVSMRDAQGRYLYVNRVWETYFQLSPAAVYGRSLEEVLPPESARIKRASDEAVLRDGLPRQAQQRLPSASGTMEDWLTFKFRLQNRNGEFSVGSVAVNMTDRLQAQKILEKTQALQQAILDSVNYSIIAADRTGRVTIFNPTAEKWLGYSASEVVEHQSILTFHLREELQKRAADLALQCGCEVSADQEVFLTPLRMGYADEREWSYRTKSGHHLPVLLSVTALRGPDQEITGFLAVGMDITESRRAKAELQKAKEAAEAANRSKSEFLANISHEIRTPMTAIIGHAEMLQDPGMEAMARTTSLRAISRNSQHLLLLINDLLDISKIEAGKMILDLQVCSPLQIVSEVISVMRPTALEKHLTLKVEYIGPIPQMIRTDSTRLRQILLNLVSNAIKFTDTGGVRLLVRLLDSTSVENPRLGFQVIDTGVGISPVEIPRLFKPFSQGDSSVTRRFGGSGLGLAICQRLAWLLGGDIRMESIYGAGTTVSVHLTTGSLRNVPLAINPQEAEATFTNTPTVPPVALCGRILLAEDGVDNQYLIATFLRKAGATVQTADNGLLAVEEVMLAAKKGAPYDLILMDMQMPEMDGYTATRKLRHLEFHKSIVALTAHAMPGDREKCLAAGCDDYLTKPIDRAKMLQVLGAILTASPAPRAPVEPLVSALAKDPEMTSVVERFVVNLTSRMAQLQRLWQKEEAESLRVLVHQLKGAAGSYGFQEITDAAWALEQQLLANIPLRKCQENFERLLEICRRVTASAPEPGPAPVKKEEPLA